MKHANIQRLRDAGSITGEQRDGGNKLLAIVSVIGAVLNTTGIILEGIKSPAVEPAPL